MAQYSAQVDEVFVALADPTRPAAPAPVACTATITLADHPDGTDYRVIVRHGDPEVRALHEKLGFEEGWGTVTAQLAALADG
ncbi:SRPBCC domain-containing protein [Kutzneria sp. NPDC052558]|uniref:SRPBCC domain-containing protein n=1 Tax=Kutzneria sp. NPDC052558 TaxID=3364121 RepID=UPI0037C5D32A